MIPTLVFVLVVAHFIADFLCQTDWMALNKSKNWWALTSHVGAYMAVLIGSTSIWLIWMIGVRAPMPMGAMAFWGVNAAAHFVQDAITSRWTTKLWFVDLSPRPPGGVTFGAYPYFAAIRETRHNFFVVIGLDQCLHYMVLFMTANWWLR